MSRRAYSSLVIGAGQPHRPCIFAGAGGAAVALAELARRAAELAGQIFQ